MQTLSSISIVFISHVTLYVTLHVMIAYSEMGYCFVILSENTFEVQIQISFSHIKVKNLLNVVHSLSAACINKKSHLFKETGKGIYFID